MFFYKLEVYRRWGPSSYTGRTMAHYKLYIDSNEIEVARYSGGGGSYEEMYDTIMWTFEIGNTDDIANGKLLSWNSLKTIKVQAREWGSNYEAQLHKPHYWDGVETGQPIIKPRLEIVAIGESSGQAVTLTNNSINDLSDISFNSTSTTDGQALVWNSTDSVWEAGAVASSGGGGLTDLSATSIADLSDVSFNSASTNQGSGLIWNNTDKIWEPGTLTASITNTTTTQTTTTGWNQITTSGTITTMTAYSDIVVYNDSGTDYLIFATGWNASASTTIKKHIDIIFQQVHGENYQRQLLYQLVMDQLVLYTTMSIMYLVVLI